MFPPLLYSMLIGSFHISLQFPFLTSEGILIGFVPPLAQPIPVALTTCLFVRSLGQVPFHALALRHPLPATSQQLAEANSAVGGKGQGTLPARMCENGSSHSGLPMQHAMAGGPHAAHPTDDQYAVRFLGAVARYCRLPHYRSLGLHVMRVSPVQSELGVSNSYFSSYAGG